MKRLSSENSKKLLLTGLLAIGCAKAVDQLDIAEFINFNDQYSFEVSIININADNSKKSFTVGNSALHLFSLDEGEFAIALRPTNDGKVLSNLYQKHGDTYKLLGEKRAPSTQSETLWESLGIQINIRDVAKIEKGFIGFYQ
jgi:hypothetical protein